MELSETAHKNQLSGKEFIKLSHKPLFFFSVYCNRKKDIKTSSIDNNNTNKLKCQIVELLPDPKNSIKMINIVRIKFANSARNRKVHYHYCTRS